MKKVAVILSGCGVYDGAEIHESVLALYAVEQNHASWHCFAPNIKQHHVINHLTGEEAGETRNVLVEAARIARGNIKDLSELNVDDFDALLLPGGFGAAKNLSDVAFKGAEASLNAEVTRVGKAFASAGKPACYICIAPMMLPLIYGQSVKGTIGTDEQFSTAFNAMGGQHINCRVNDIMVDATHKVISTPAYMLAGSISEAASGINLAVKKLIEMA